MALNVWTRPTGWNFGQEPGTNLTVSSGNFIPGYKYVIQSVGTTDFKKIGSEQSVVGTIFTAANSGAGSGPVQTDPETGLTFVSPGSGTASRLAFSERVNLTLLLPVQNTDGVDFKIISGKLPGGLRLTYSTTLLKWVIEGSAFEVPRLTDFQFCIRASKNGIISDRTFFISIEGEDKPEFITGEGLLAMGDDNELFIPDSSFVDFQIEAVDKDTTTGQKLSFFIAKGDGQLPPGLILTDDGRIVGFVQPILAIKPTDGDGTFDNSYYDAVAYDFAFVPTNGYDSYIYDSVFFDFSLPSTKPRKLNRTYEFYVTVTDGDSFERRRFKIYVVGDDYFRADNTTLLTGNPLFTTDVTYLRPPTWITPGYLGLYRANNYITLILDTYETENIIYNLELINANTKATTRKISINDNKLASTQLTVTRSSTAPVVGNFLTFQGKVTGSTKIFQILNVANLGNNEYRLTLNSDLEVSIPDSIDILIGTMSQLPPGMQFDENNAEVHGLVPYQPNVTKTYTFTVTASKLGDNLERANTSKIFTVDLLGEVDSILNWTTPSDLGKLNANFVSTLSVIAESNIEDNTVLYTIIEGSLPPGLSLDLNGEIVGKVNQYGTTDINGNIIIPGLTTFDFSVQATTFDGGTTTSDRVYEFTVKAQDKYGYSSITRTFRITIETPNQKVFSNIKVQPLLKTKQRTIWQEFISNATIFTPTSIYRSNDPNFGIQSDLAMIIVAGIETKEASTYISAMGLNHKRKRFQFGNVKKATAIIPGTKIQLYEVIYVEMLDPLEINGKYLPLELKNLGRNPNSITVDSSNVLWSRNLNDLNIDEPYSKIPLDSITVDSLGYQVSNPNFDKYFPNSVSIWRERFTSWTDGTSTFDQERNYLPLWMRSIQPGTRQEADFQLAVPLCYCKVGLADEILLNIKNHIRTTGFSFNQLDYTVDRYIIDSVEGLTADKYLVFRNDRITI